MESGWLYAIALGSNRPLSGIRSPEKIVAEAMESLDEKPLTLLAKSQVIGSAPIGPSQRRFANAAVIVSTRLDPPALLRHLKHIERRFRRRRGQRWGARTLDLDIILWSGGSWRRRELHIPHTAFRERAFVLKPLAMIAPDWRDCRTGLCIRYMAFRIDRRKPVDRTLCPL